MKILIVEDEVDNIDLLSFLFEDAGYSVAAAKTAEESLHCAAEEQYDIVLMDVSLPGAFGGPEAIRRLRERPNYRKTPIVVITAFVEAKVHAEARSAGADAVVTKPISDLNGLLKLVSDLTSATKHE